MLQKTAAAMGAGLLTAELADLGVEPLAFDRLGLAAVGALVIVWVLQRLTKQLDEIERRLDELNSRQHDE